jgi:light-regulated signal transduction histidine kinase (bacteriophytochrome)
MAWGDRPIDSLDLGQVGLRGGSQPHLQYLQTMGVASSMTLSLTTDRHL